jgi:hypothetical protein
MMIIAMKFREMTFLSLVYVADLRQLAKLLIVGMGKELDCAERAGTMLLLPLSKTILMKIRLTIEIKNGILLLWS